MAFIGHISLVLLVPASLCQTAGVAAPGHEAAYRSIITGKKRRRTLMTAEQSAATAISGS